MARKKESISEMATQEVGKLVMKAYQAKDDIEKAAKGGMKQLAKKWEENKSKLPMPEKLAGKVDDLIGKLGLKEAPKKAKPKAKKPPVKKAAPKKAVKSAQGEETAKSNN